MARNVLNQNCSITIQDSNMLRKLVITSMSDEIFRFEEKGGQEKLSEIASKFFYRSVQKLFFISINSIKFIDSLS